MSKTRVCPSRDAKAGGHVYTTQSLLRVWHLASFLAVLPAVLFAQDQSTETLTNKSVIAMVVGKLPKEVIADKINRHER